MQNQAPALRHFSQFSYPRSGTCRDFFVTHHASKDDNLQTLIRQGIPLFFIVKNLVQKIELKSK